MNAADVAELAPEQLAQEAQLRPGQALVGVDDPLDVLDLEDRVREGLGRAVVDLLGEPRPLRLLGLDDPHLRVRRRGGARRLVTRLASPRSRKSHVLSRFARDLDLRSLWPSSRLVRRRASGPQVVLDAGRGTDGRRRASSGRRASAAIGARARRRQVARQLVGVAVGVEVLRSDCQRPSASEASR